MKYCILLLAISGGMMGDYANFSIDGKIENRISANKQLKDAGIKQQI